MTTYIEAIPAGKGNHLKHRFIPSVLPGVAMPSICERHRLTHAEIRLMMPGEERTACPKCYPDAPMPQDRHERSDVGRTDPLPIPVPVKPRGPSVWTVRWRPKDHPGVGRAIFRCGVEVPNESEAYEAVRAICRPVEIEILGASLDTD